MMQSGQSHIQIMCMVRHACKSCECHVLDAKRKSCGKTDKQYKQYDNKWLTYACGRWYKRVRDKQQVPACECYKLKGEGTKSCGKKASKDERHARYPEYYMNDACVRQHELPACECNKLYNTNRPCGKKASTNEHHSHYTDYYLNHACVRQYELPACECSTLYNKDKPCGKKASKNQRHTQYTDYFLNACIKNTGTCECYKLLNDVKPCGKGATKCYIEHDNLN